MAKQDSTIDDIRQLCVDFGLPLVVILITGALLLTGKDSEVKTIFAMAAGWLFKSGIIRGVPRKKCHDS
jgi:hypothetical protein